MVRRGQTRHSRYRIMLFLATMTGLATQMCNVRAHAHSGPLKQQPALGLHIGYSYLSIASLIDGKVYNMPEERCQEALPVFLRVEDGHLWADLSQAASPEASSNVTGSDDGKPPLQHGANDQILTGYMSCGLQGRANQSLFSVTMNDNNPDADAAPLTDHMAKKAISFVHDYLHEGLHEAVAAAPVSFTDAQKEILKEVYRKQGFELLRIMKDALVAAWAYYGRHTADERAVLVFNFEKTWMEVTVLMIDNGVYEILSNVHDGLIGGEDFSDRLLNLLLNRTWDKCPGRARHGPGVYQNVQKEAERVLHALTLKEEVALEDTCTDHPEDEAASHYHSSETSLGTVSRGMLEALTSDLAPSVMQPITQALQKAQLEAGDIGSIVMMGSSAGVWPVQSQLRRFFSGKELMQSIRPEHVAAVGAAAVHEYLRHDNSDVEMYTSDVLPLSLGIETVGALRATVLPRSLIIPNKKRKAFVTVDPRQDRVALQVLGGRGALAEDNCRLGRLRVLPVPPAARSVRGALLEVQFEMNESWTELVVTVGWAGTGDVERIVIPAHAILACRLTLWPEEYADHEGTEKPPVGTARGIVQGLITGKNGSCGLESRSLPWPGDGVVALPPLDNCLSPEPLLWPALADMGDEPWQ